MVGPARLWAAAASQIATNGRGPAPSGAGAPTLQEVARPLERLDSPGGTASGCSSHRSIDAWLIAANFCASVSAKRSEGEGHPAGGSTPPGPAPVSRSSIPRSSTTDSMATASVGGRRGWNRLPQLGSATTAGSGAIRPGAG